MSISSKLTLWLTFVPFVIFAQTSDTLFIRFSDSLLNKSVFINQIDVYGDTIKNPKSDNITFLFSNVNLMNKLKERIKREKNGVIFGYSAGLPQYGIEMNYYQLSISEYENYEKQQAKYLKLIQDLKGKDVKKKNLERLRENLFRTLYPPLQQLYVRSGFLKDKPAFSYKGTKESYKQLKEKLGKYSYIYIVMPFDFSNVYNYERQLIQVRERYIMPGL